MHNIVGNAVTGDNLFGREREVALCWEYLQHDHLLIPAPRRVGKTSIMQALQADAANKGYHAVYLTVESAVDEEGLLAKMCDHVIPTLPTASKTRHFLGKKADALAPIKVGPFKLKKSTHEMWQNHGERLQNILGDDSRRWLLLIDELPVFLGAFIRRCGGNTQRAQELLDWLRSLRGGEYSHVRWVFCGSVGLESVAERYKMTPAINDLRRFSLGPFSVETARNFLTGLANTHQLPIAPEAMERILERCGWLIPFHLQLFFSALREQNNASLPLQPSHVDDAYESLLSSSSRSYFIHWKDRLIQELGEVEGKHAIFLLDKVAQPAGGEDREILSQAMAKSIRSPEKRESAVDALLTLLERDGYLVQEENRFRFRSPLLREFWLRHVARKGSK